MNDPDKKEAAPAREAAGSGEQGDNGIPAPVPQGGRGVHPWLFHMTRVLHPYRTENAARTVLDERRRNLCLP